MLIPTHRRPTSPGEILLEQFLKPLGISQTALAERLGIPIQRVNLIVNGKRGITSETAWLLAGALSTTPEFWMNMQTGYDLAVSKPKKLPAPFPGAKAAARQTA